MTIPFWLHPESRCLKRVLQEVAKVIQMQFVRKQAQDGKGTQDQVQNSVTPDVRLLVDIMGEMSRERNQERFSLTDQKHFLNKYGNAVSATIKDPVLKAKLKQSGIYSDYCLVVVSLGTPFRLSYPKWTED